MIILSWNWRNFDFWRSRVKEYRCTQCNAVVMRTGKFLQLGFLGIGHVLDIEVIASGKRP